jgi:hypothetical protein
MRGALFVRRIVFVRGSFVRRRGFFRSLLRGRELIIGILLSF